MLILLKLSVFLLLLFFFFLLHYLNNFSLAGLEGFFPFSFWCSRFIVETFWRFLSSFLEPLAWCFPENPFCLKTLPAFLWRALLAIFPSLWSPLCLAKQIISLKKEIPSHFNFIWRLSNAQPTPERLRGGKQRLCAASSEWLASALLRLITKPNKIIIKKMIMKLFRAVQRLSELLFCFHSIAGWIIWL